MGTYANTTVVNISGYNPGLCGNLQLTLPPEVQVCSNKLKADWGDHEVAFIQAELDRNVQGDEV